MTNLSSKREAGYKNKEFLRMKHIWIYLLVSSFAFFTFSDMDDVEVKSANQEGSPALDVAQPVNQQTAPVVVIDENSAPSSSEIPSQPIAIEPQPALSKAEKLQESRKKLEQQTTDTLREKLEIMRLQDEQKRLNQLLPDSSTQPETEVVSPASQQAQGAVSNASRKSVVGRAYIAPGIGWIDYVDTFRSPYYNTVNLNEVINPRYLFSFGLGGYLTNHLSMEVIGAMSKHLLRFPNYNNNYQNRFTQYTSHILLKTHLALNKFRPFFGVAMAVSLRRYSPDPAQLSPYGGIYLPLIASTSYFDFDGGLTVGLDLLFTHQFGLGCEFLLLLL